MSMALDGGPGGAGRPDADPRRDAAADLRVAAVIVLALAVVGALLGLVWAAWSPPGPIALVRSAGLQPDETEAFVAGDGRYLVLSAVAGLLAGLLAWTRSRQRGPIVLLALAVGGLAGSLLLWAVGRLTGGGSTDGKVNTIVARLPLTLHAHGLLFLQAGVAVLVYGLLVAFAARDDLGRPDPLRDRLHAAATAPPGAHPAPGHPGPYPPPYPPPGGYPGSYPPPSVAPDGQSQDGGGHRDAAGPLQQRDLPPQ
ncbi:Protein of unknown function [Jatrophihabitans endophyticus]|uniref:DUF2567 domain-containing protein n=1 Tax=Jatrophihabitans endophyticus TaxID=1206085 RepID=A0A1M5LDJ6_9ACTN|nr:DUF2567 domain-containing protein [Jatrophihabitans endophyticus]SHG63025.1 Protein of unknown function [Jatrophihabitans endophyticus]